MEPLKARVEAPGVKVPALVKFPSRVWVNEPADSDPFSVKFPVNVRFPRAVFVPRPEIVKWWKLLELIVLAPELVRLTVEVPGLNVPVLVQFWATVRLKLEVDKVAPVFKERLPPIFIAFTMVVEAVPERVKFPLIVHPEGIEGRVLIPEPERIK